jgi:hypothetical protein
VAGLIEEGVSVEGGEALVEEVEGEVGVGLAGGFLECVGEGESLLGLWAGRAVGVEWIADEYGLDLVLAHEAGDGFEIGAEACAVKGEEWLSGEAERVRNGDPDTAIAHI